MKTILTLKDASAGYHDKVVLKKINLNIYKNDFLAVIGPNGGGKTTLVKLMVGLLPLQSGSISFSSDIAGHNKPVIGYLPQVKTVDQRFPISVLDVVLSGIAGKNTSKNENLEQAEALLSQTGMLSFKNKAIGTLSGGQTQRVFLCRALISSPELLILDEPNTFVDNDFSKNFHKLLQELNKKMAIVIVSHDTGVIASYIKNIACVNGSLHYHASAKISAQVLEGYKCPVELLAHGKVPHRVVENHGGEDV